MAGGGGGRGRGRGPDRDRRRGGRHPRRLVGKEVEDPMLKASPGLGDTRLRSSNLELALPGGKGTRPLAAAAAVAGPLTSGLGPVLSTVDEK